MLVTCMCALHEKRFEKVYSGVSWLLHGFWFVIVAAACFFICSTSSMSFVYKRKELFQIKQKFFIYLVLLQFCLFFFYLFSLLLFISVTQSCSDLVFVWFSVCDAFSLQKLFWHEFNVGSNRTGPTDWLDCHTLTENNNNGP